MSKRLTDTDKWKKKFFRDLSLEAKLAWLYLCDNCDHAGIWIIDVETLNTQTRLNFTLTSLLEAFSNNVVLFDNGERLWLRSFYFFQYEDSKANFAAKLSAIKKLNKYGLQVDSLTTLPGQSPHTPSDNKDTPSESKDSLSKSISNSKGNSKSKKDISELPEQIVYAWAVWNDTLEEFKIPRKNISPPDQTFLARSIQNLGFDRVVNALEGKRYERETKTFSPASCLSLDYCLRSADPKTGKSNHERLENLALATRAAAEDQPTQEDLDATAKGVV